jgi:hypothetical protein
MTEKTEFRDTKGRFTKGYKSGHRKPKRILNTLDGRNVFELARSACPEMLEVLYKIATDKNEKSTTRMLSASIILDRGLGKPVSQTIVTADVASLSGSEVDVTQFSEDRLMTLIAQHENATDIDSIIDGEIVIDDE